jgi:hypothetical protein
MSKEVSQVFGGIGDAVSGVLKGVGDAVDGAVKGVGSLAKQIYDSDVGKAIIIAGAIYFGGAALSGGFGSYGAGGSFFSGMGTGVVSAADSIGLAWTESSLGPLGNAWGAAGDAGANAARFTADSVISAVPSATSAAAPPVAPAPAAAVAPAPTASLGAPPPTVAAAPGGTTVGTYSLGNASVPQITQASASLPPVDQSWYSKAIDYITPKSELAKYGLISGATQLAGGLIQGAGQEQAVKDEREAQAAALKAAQDLRNANMAGELWAPSQYAAAAAPAAVTAAPTGFYKRYMPQSDVAGSRFAQAYAGLPPGQGLVRSVMG